jgi:hypothetical protein
MSTIVTSNVSDGTLSIPTTFVTNGSAKAWVNFNGTGTIAARDSLNVASLTDNGTGDYTVNFSNAFADVNYTHAGMAGDGNGNLVNVSQNVAAFAPTASASRYQTTTANVTTFDTAFVGTSAMGDLA